MDAKKFGAALGQLAAFFIVALLLLKMWAAIAAAFTLPIFSYWFWLGWVYVIDYFMRNR